MFEWDQAKRRVNLAKHGVDFEAAKLIFDGITLESPDARRDYGEQRIGAYGKVFGVVLFVVYTWRDKNCRRIISARKAGSHEKAIYDAQIAAQKADDEG